VGEGPALAEGPLAPFLLEAGLVRSGPGFRLAGLVIPSERDPGSVIPSDPDPGSVIPSDPDEPGREGSAG
jgi:hypothetical protein